MSDADAPAEPAVNPLREVGLLRVRTDALAREMDTLYREAARIARICDRQAAELQQLRAAPIEAQFHHCDCCPQRATTPPAHDHQETP